MVSKFLLNIFSKGSICLDEGRLYLWNNPFLFIPISSFAILQKNIIDILGSDGEKLIYWLGQIQGYNSSKVIISRFGFKPTSDNFKYFVDGSTMVGMGTIELENYDLNKNEAILKCSNSTLARKYFQLFGKSQKSVDHYLCGILAGGAEPLINTKTNCIEEDCIAMGKEKCIYHLVNSDIIIKPNIVDEIIIDSKKILEGSSSLYLKRKSFFKNILSEQLVTFSDGSIKLQDIEGLIIPTYVQSILNYVLAKKDLNRFYNVLNTVAEDYVTNFNIEPKILSANYSKEKLNGILTNFDKFGFGQLRYKGYYGSKLVIENISNPYPLDYKSLFGNQESCVDYFLECLLKAIFLKYLNKKVNVKEVECIARGKQSCLFHIEDI